IFIYDNYQEPESRDMNNIEIAISKDYNVYYDGYGNFEKPFQADNNVSFEGFTGIIYVPKITAIEILETSKTIVGMTASPMYITSKGSISLEIEEDSGLELCLKDTKKTIVNDLICKRNGVSARGEFKYTGKSFDKHYRDYSNYMLDIIDQAQKNKTDFGTKLNYNKIYDIKNIDVCDYSNIIYVDTNGSKYFKYTEPTTYAINNRNREFVNYREYLRKKISKSEKISQDNNTSLEERYRRRIFNAKTESEKIKLYEEIDREIRNAILKEDYEIAAKLRDLITPKDNKQ
ncbi:MAG TPA: hypothetical protein V6C58_27715, partial [Allocoleopsis sp.]